MTAFFYDCLTFCHGDSREMEKAARNHGEESLSSITLRLPLPCVKIDNQRNLVGGKLQKGDRSRKRERKTGPDKMIIIS